MLRIDTGSPMDLFDFFLNDFLVEVKLSTIVKNNPNEPTSYDLTFKPAAANIKLLFSTNGQEPCEVNEIRLHSVTTK